MKPRAGSFMRAVLDYIDHVRVTNNEELSRHFKRDKHYVGKTAYNLWRVGSVSREGRGIWHTKTNL